MFGINSLHRQVRDLWFEVFGHEGDHGKPASYSLVNKVNRLESFKDRNQTILDGMEPHRPFMCTTRLPGVPPLERRLEEIEKALGITYEYEPRSGPHWSATVKPRAKK